MNPSRPSGPSGWRLDPRVLETMTIPALAVTAAGVVVHGNPVADRLVGGRIGTLVGVDVRDTVFASSAADLVDGVLDRVVAGEAWSGTVALRDLTGMSAQTVTCWTPIHEGDRITGALVLLQDPAPRSETGALGGRLPLLASVTTALLTAPDLDAVTTIVVEQLADAAGATVASLSLLVDDDTLALVGMRGGRPGAASRWATYPVDAVTPAGDAVRSGRPVLLSGAEEIERRYPGLESAHDGERSLVCLPLQVEGRPLGVASLSFAGARRIDDDALQFLGVLADNCALAVARIRASEEAADREVKARFLVEASAELASDLDHEKTLKRVAELAVPWFADWCSIALLQDGVLRTLKVAHNDPSSEPLIEELQAHYPAQESATVGGYQVIRTGESELIPEIADQLLVEVAQDDRHLEVMRALQMRSALTVPLRAGSRIFGVVTWVTGEHGRRFGTEDVRFGEDLAQRAGVAIDNALLHSELRDTALRLQRAVLPGRLPRPEGTDVSVRYLPAGRSGTGGDFYDLLVLDEDRICLFVGDVMGRGVEAASVMAQMRSAVRTLIAVDPSPVRVMVGLDRVFERWHVEQLVSLAYVVVDLAADRLTAVNAGHPPPLVVGSDGVPAEVETIETLILGAGGGPRSVVSRSFRAGDTLLLYTDGLVERRGEDTEQGLDRLTQACSSLDDRDLSASLDRIVDLVRDPSRDDDVAILALRRRLGTEDPSD